MDVKIIVTIFQKNYKKNDSNNFQETYHLLYNKKFHIKKFLKN